MRGVEGSALLNYVLLKVGDGWIGWMGGFVFCVLYFVLVGLRR